MILYPSLIVCYDSTQLLNTRHHQSLSLVYGSINDDIVVRMTRFVSKLEYLLPVQCHNITVAIFATTNSHGCLVAAVWKRV